jgi:hypothetical protein
MEDRARGESQLFRGLAHFLQDLAHDTEVKYVVDRNVSLGFDIPTRALDHILKRRPGHQEITAIVFSIVLISLLGDIQLGSAPSRQNLDSAFGIILNKPVGAQQSAGYFFDFVPVVLELLLMQPDAVYWKGKQIAHV